MSVVDARLAALEARMAALEARLAGGATGGVVAPQAVGQGAIATDYDLDSEWGDEIVKKDPPRWRGESFAGCKMSQCSADYLNELAGFFDWKAMKDAEQGSYKNAKGEIVPTKPQYAQKSAARARGWAKRNAGLSTAPAANGNDNGASQQSDQDEIPF
jgi:hypothetical protein